MGFLDEIELEGKKMQLLVVEPVNPKLTKALERLQKMGDDGSSLAQPVVCPTPDEGVQLAQKLEGSLIIFGMSKQPEMVAAINSLRHARKKIDEGKIKVVFMVAGKAPDESIMKKLRSVGVSEFITEPVTDRALILKVERLVKAHPRFKELQRGQNGSHDRSGKGAKQGREAGGKKNQEGSSELKKSPALAIKSDFWLAGPGGARKLGPRWVARLVGPSPAVAKWNQFETDGRGGGSWRWEPLQKEGDPFHHEPGSWVFKGQRPPQFSENQWWFSGSEMSLEWTSEGKPNLVKFAIEENGALRVAADTADAARIMDLIELSYSKTLTQKRGKTDDGDAAALLKEKDQASDTNDEFSGAGAYGAHDAGDRSPFRLVAPLTLASDFWTFEEDGRVKKISSRLSIRIIGPGRRAGHWLESPSSDKSVRYWRWHPTPEDDKTFIKDAGFWLFRGDQPIFLNSRWVLVSDAPELAFWNEGKKVVSRISMAADGKAEVARDSEASRIARPLIEATLDMEAEIKAAESKELEAQLEGEGESPELGATQEAEEGTDLEITLSKKKKREKDLRTSSDEEESDDADDIEQDGPSLGRLKKRRRSDSSEKSGEKKEATSDDADEDSDEEESSSETKSKKKNHAKDSGSSDASTDEVEPIDEEVVGIAAKPKKKSAPENRTESGEENPETTEASEAEPEARSEAIEKKALEREVAEKKATEKKEKSRAAAVTKEAGPNVTPLALAFYVSEVMRGKDRTPTKVAEKTVRYLSHSCAGGMKVDLLKNESSWSHWVCSHKEPGTDLEKISSVIPTKAGSVVARGENFVVVGVGALTGETIGALCISGAEVARLPDAYLLSIAKCWVGLFLSREESAAFAAA